MQSLFFFSSRRRHTRSDRDWSSDVCSSDLREGDVVEEMERQIGRQAKHLNQRLGELEGDAGAAEVLVLRLAVGTPRVEDGVRGRQLVAWQVMVRHDDIHTGGTGGRDGSVRCYSTIAGDDQL